MPEKEESNNNNKEKNPRLYTYLLLLLLGAGLIFRLWGLLWGLNSATALHPDEAGDCNVIYQMIQGDFSRVGLDTWYFIYNYCIAVIYIFFQKMAYWGGLIFSVYRVGSEVRPNMVLMGRITSVIFSTFNIWLLYITGKKIFKSRPIGLMAAAILAVTPLAVAQAHYLEMDSPLAFFATLSLLCSFLILSSKSSLFFLLGGLVYGLTFTTKPNGLLLIIPFLISFSSLFFDGTLKKTRIVLLKRIFLFLVTALIGFVLGTPGLFVNFSKTIQRVFGVTMEMSRKSPPWTGAWVEGPQGTRFAWAFQTLIDGFGVVLLVIICLGIIYYLLRKNKEVILTCSFPIGYFLIVWIWGRRFGERDVVVMIPFLALMSATFFHNFLNYWYSWRFKKWVMTILFLGLLVWPTWKSMEVDYYYWLEDNRDLSGKWLNQNIPPEKIIALDGYTPYDINFSTIYFEPAQPLEYYRNKSDFVVTSTLEGDRYFSLWTHRPIRPEGKNLLLLQKRFTLIKEFDLKHQGTEIEKNGSLQFPDFVDPIIRVYATKAEPIKHKITFPVLCRDGDLPFKVVFLNHPEYEKSNNLFVVKPDSESERVLRAPQKLKRIQIILYSENQAKVTIKLGTAKKDKEMEAGQIEMFDIKPGLDFPFIRNIYQMKVSSQSKGNLYVKWVVNPEEMGLNWLNEKQPKMAIPCFKEAYQTDPENLENQAFLGVAYYEDGKTEEAATCFREIEKKAPGYFSKYYALAKSNLTNEEWLKSFCDYSKYYFPLIQKRSTDDYVLPKQCAFPDRFKEFSKENFVGHYNKGEDGLIFFKLWGRDVFPEGFFNVHFHLSIESANKKNYPILRLDILKHTPNSGFHKIAEKIISNGEIKATQRNLQDIYLPLKNDARSGQFEFRVFALHKQANFIIHNIEVEVDIKKALEENMKIMLYALAKTYQSHSDYEAAIIAFKRLFDLSPEYNDVCRHLGNLLLQTGDRSGGLFYYHQYEKLNKSNPLKLKWLLDQYQKINEPTAVKKVQNSLDRLPSPQIDRRAIFSNKIELRGFSLGKTRAKRGETIKGSLLWEDLEKMDRNYAIFLHVEKNDQIIFQGDQLPQAGEKPFGSLTPGEIIKKDFQLKIPANVLPGSYKIYLGLWDPTYSGKRLNISSPSQNAYKDKCQLTTLDLY